MMMAYAETKGEKIGNIERTNRKSSHRLLNIGQSLSSQRYSLAIDRGRRHQVEVEIESWVM